MSPEIQKGRIATYREGELVEETNFYLNTDIPQIKKTKTLKKIIFIFFPKILNFLGEQFNIGRGVDLAFYIILPLLSIMTLRSSIRTRENTQRINKLVRQQTLDQYNKDNCD